MERLLPIPNPARVRAACQNFDERYPVVEGALQEIFGHYRRNTNESHVLLKVVTLNRLYSAGILAVESVARHIFESGTEIDSALEAGESHVVDRIAKVPIEGKEFNFFSFSTKFCNWHKPELYPIYDSRVDQYLWSLQKHEPFSKFFQTRADMRKDYGTFFRIMTDLRRHYALEELTFKEIDKFLWLENEMGTPTGKGLQHYLDMVPDASPDSGDELPKGWTAQ